MKISIITATLNNKSGLLRAIESVRNQTYKNVEHIIIDGGSTDGTLEAIYNLQCTIYNSMDSEASLSIKNTSKTDEINSEISSQADEKDFNKVTNFRNDKEQINALEDSSMKNIPSNEIQSDDNKIYLGSKFQIPKSNYKLYTDHYSLITISEPDNGIYDAINKGIKLATGDVIGLLHSDDFYADESVLGRYAMVFQDKNLEGKDESLGQVEAVYSDLLYVRSKMGDEKREKNNLDHNDYSKLKTSHFVIRNWKAHNLVNSEQPLRQAQDDKQITIHYSLITTHQLLSGWMPPHPTLFLRKEVFEKYGLYRTDMKIASDYEMILRLFYKYNIISQYLPLTTYCMTTGGASNRSLKNIIRKSSEDFYAMKLHRLPFPLKTLLLKNLRKLPQFFNYRK